MTRDQKKFKRLIETLYVILGQRNQTIGEINQSLPREFSCNERTTRRDISLLLWMNMIGRTNGKYFAKVRISQVESLTY